MNNMWSRLLGMLSSNSKQKTGALPRKARKRRLRVEAMEQRQLLAVDSLAGITGNVFTDLMDDDLDAGDTPIQAATVRLLQDNNQDGLLDAGDTELTTAQTDANGDYIFDGLSAGFYLVEQLAVTGQLQRTTESVKAVQIINDDGTIGATIDSFETPTTPDPLEAAGDPNNPVTAEDVQTNLGNEVIGGERDVFLVNDAGSQGNITFDVNASGQVLVSTAFGTTGDLVIEYDGVDGNANAIGHNLGDIDITSNFQRAIEFAALAQVGSNLTVEVYSGANNASVLTQAIATAPDAGSQTARMLFCYDDFQQLQGTNGPADFTAVTAIVVRADLLAADDILFDIIGFTQLDVETRNFANLNPISIGDTVFQDDDNDGALDAGESGISGVDVQLFLDDGNGVFDNGTDTNIGTATTDANGNYAFTDLLPGDYFAVVPIAEFASGQALAGFVSSSGNDPAPDPDNNVDGDDNGTLIAGVGVATAAFTLSAAGETNDGDNDENNNPSIDFGFVPEVDLSVDKTVSTSQVAAGNEVTYTIVVTNEGLTTANNVILIDDLPNLSPNNLTVTGTTSTLGSTVTQTGNDNGELRVDYATLAPTQSDTITITVLIPATAAAQTAVTNTATVSADETESNPDNNTSSADISIVRTADLLLTKTDTPDPIAVGEQLTYEIAVTNNGPSTATNVVMTDPLPTGLTFDSVTVDPTASGTASATNNSVTGNIPTLGVGETVTFTVFATINQNFAGTTLTNTATAVADEDTGGANSSTTTTVNPSVDLILTKSDSADPTTRGSQLVYTLQVRNNGMSPATNVQVVDTLPAGVTFVNATGGTVTPPSNGNQQVTFDLGTINAGSSQSMTIVVDIEDTAADTITNNATATSTEGTNGFEETPADNTTSEDTTLTPTIDLSITKDDGVTAIDAGNQLTYTIEVTNEGPSTANNVAFTDTLPAGVTFVSASSTTGSVANNNGVVEGNLGSLALDATSVVTIVVTVDADTLGTITNTAQVSADEQENITINNSATHQTPVNRSVDLAIDKTTTSTNVQTGDTLTYELVVTNEGPSVGTSVVVTDTLPADLTLDSARSTSGTVTTNGNTLNVDIGTMNPTDTVTITVDATVVGTTTGTITNTATVAAAEAEDVTANNESSAQITLDPEPLSKRRLLASTM